MASKPPQPVVQELLARAHSPDSANRIYSEKIQHRPLYLRPTSPPPSATARDARRKAREQKAKDRKKALKPKPLSSRERRRLGLYDVPRERQKYTIYEPLHKLWLGYMHEILGHEVYTGGQNAAAKLSAADFHGAEVEVVRSGCVGRVGIRGIVIKDSRFVFEIITKENKLKTVPKEGTMFRVEIPVQDGQNAAQQNALAFEIRGSQFQHRSADRANKKLKAHFLEDL